MRIRNNTQTTRQRVLPWLSGIALGGLLGLSVNSAAIAALPHISGSDNLAKYTGLPVTSVERAQPQAMITLSKDHSLWLKAYNDYTDLTENGIPETTYLHSFRYYGYFDDNKCYSHNGTRFEPAAFANAQRYCNGSTWSGNFLNWASMARVDVVRRILFGGKRHIDGSISADGANHVTVLDRAYLPNDAHSWAKYYNGPDINQLTPFNPPTNNANQLLNGITICNTTRKTDNPGSGQFNEPPLIRVARGNFSLWAANERWQCLWQDESPISSNNANRCTSNPGSIGCNDNVPAITGISAHNRSPIRATESLGTGDYIARVRVCVPGLEQGDRCKRYPDGTLKPIGLLQEYGDNERMWFGLVTGTYSKNKSGGDLMAPPALRVTGNSPLESAFVREINVNVDGRFIQTFGLRNAAGNNTSANNAGGIINSLSLFRIVDYRHSDGLYADCDFRLASFNDGSCKNWGNPLAEAYHAALSWFGGRNQAIGAFRANESNIISGLNTPQSRNLSLTEENACASLNTIVFNSSLISYDGDQLDTNSHGPVVDLNSAHDSRALTNFVGQSEGLHGQRFFVGENGQTQPGDFGHQVCTAKTVDNLGDVRGICPEGPRLEGTFRIAGLAYHAHSNNINAGITGDQSVKTFVVQLASATPTVRIPVPGSNPQRFVTLLPACQNDDLNPDTTANRLLKGACSIIDFKIAEPHTVVDGVGTGKLYVNWENGEQGGDFDQDMWGIIDYQITATQITVGTNVIGYSGGNARMGFGYILSGTTQDGVHYHSGAGGAGGEGGGTGRNAGPFFFQDPTGTPDCRQSRAGAPGNQPGCRLNDPRSTRTYTLGASDARQLRDPLWYAAKYGGYTGQHNFGSGQPLQQHQWDTRNARGEPIPDGNPDNYFLAIEPRQLEDALRRVFDEIIGQVASGTAAAVVANAQEGEGAVYQALFEPIQQDGENEVRWIGSLHSLWVDENGRLREHDGTAGNERRLGDFASNPVVELFYDETVDPPRTRLRRFSGDPDEGDFTELDLGALNPLWNARDALARLPNVQQQRSYSNPASSGRYMFTWLDLNLDGRVQGDGVPAVTGETRAFLPSTFTGGRAGILNAPNDQVATQIVNYVRGVDQPGLRNRTMNYFGDGNVTLRLGDIVNSTPVAVGAPAEAFDLLYDDETYATFRRQYQTRRNVVYVGSNSGVLHAFNAGFYDAAEKRFTTSIDDETAHPLGSELWAYVPFNLLPHLTWLTNPDYTHVWYVDGKPRIFDARVFDDSPTHPGGWGTIMVVGFQFGGGDLALPLTAQANLFSGFNTANPAPQYIRQSGNTSQLVTRSAYVIMDITDPEQPPRVLAELSAEDLGFATGTPAVIAMSERGGSTEDDWYLVLGSGPDNFNRRAAALENPGSNTSARIWVYDLRQRSFLAEYNGLQLPNTLAGGNQNDPFRGQFVGGITTADWELDFKANAVYFGTVGNSPEAPTGALWKFDLRNDPNRAQWVSPTRLLDAQRPVTAVPSLAFDESGNRWVLSGTGRYLSDLDRPSTAQQTLFGVIESRASGAQPTLPVTLNSLLNVSNARVATNGLVDGVPGVSLESQLVTQAQTAGGWRMNLAVPTAAERVVTSTSVIGDIFFASAFTPTNDVCGGEGRSRLYGLNFRTGAPSSQLPTFGTTSSTIGGEQVDEAIRSVDIGAGLGSAPSLHLGGARDQRGLTIFTQTSTGSIVQTEGQISDSARSGEIDWRERY